MQLSPYFRRLVRVVFLFVTALALGGRADAQAAQPAAEQVSVEQAVSEALEKNLALQAEKANIAIARAGVITAGLRPNPVISLGGDHLDLLGTGFNADNAGGPTESTAHTEFVIERGGKRALRVEAAQAARSVAELQFVNSVRSLIFDVQSAFVDALAAREELGLARENQRFLDDIVELNRARVKAGDLAEVELMRSQLAALQFQNTVRQAELRVKTALTRLQVLIGRQPAPAFDVEGELRCDRELPALEALQAAAREQRPDLRAWREERRRAGAEFRSQLAQRTLDWSVGAEYRRQSATARSNSLGFFFSVPLPLFDRNQGGIERAVQEQRQADLRLRAAETAVAGEVESAYQQYLTARGMLESIERDMLARARDVRDITEFTYKRGGASLLELLDAQRAFNDTMQAYGGARGEYARSLYLLDSVSAKAVK